MTKTLYTLIALASLASFPAQAQVVSQFDWNANPVTKALVGPDATASAGMLAISDVNGVGGTNGLNPKSHDIAMTLPGSTFTSLTGIDISVSFLKKENGASFFTLGNLDFGIATGSIYIKYMVKVGGVDVQKTQNTQYTVTDGANFHTYRFIYNDVTGVGTLSVDGTTVQTYTNAAGSPLSWTGAGNATIASGMDGSGTNVAVLDNLVIQKVSIVLPLELLSFDVVGNKLSWATAHENSVRDFTIERSVDGINYTSIGVVAAGGSDYQFVDASPAVVSYYRLKMTDIDGSFNYSSVKKVGSASAQAVTVTCYPNPVVDYVNIKVNSLKNVPYMVTTLDGKVMQSGIISGGQASLNVAGAPTGMMVVRVANETFKIVKR